MYLKTKFSLGANAAVFPEMRVATSLASCWDYQLWAAHCRPRPQELPSTEGNYLTWSKNKPLPKDSLWPVTG